MFSFSEIFPITWPSGLLSSTAPPVCHQIKQFREHFMFKYEPQGHWNGLNLRMPDQLSGAVPVQIPQGIDKSPTRIINTLG